MRKEPSLFILILLVSFASVSAVLFTPALPELSHKLKISSEQAQLTLTVFLIGYALGALPYGPLSNRYGRKPTIFIGIVLAILGGFLILLVAKFHFFWLLLLGRLLMALGSSVGLKIAFTMVGDVYQHEKATKKISYLILSFAMIPTLAIVAGGFLTKHFGWESCFYFLTGYSIFLLILSFFLPETCPKKDLHALKVTSIYKGYLEKLKNQKLITCALLMGCGTAVFYLFAAEAPFIGINHIGLTTDQYGLLNFIPPIGLVFGSFLANFLAGRKTPLFSIAVGIILAFCVAACMLAFFLGGVINIWTLFIPLPLLYIGESLVYVNASSLIMSHAKNKSYASAMMSFVNLSMSVAALFAFDALPTRAVYLMPLLFTGILIFMLILRICLAFLMKKASI